MASDNARRFELKLGKLGLFVLICSMSGMLFAAFLFGVIIGSDLENYPGKISRRLPARFLEWAGLLEPEKPNPVAVVIKSEKPVTQPESTVPEAVTPPAVVPPVSSEKKDLSGATVTPSVSGKDQKPPAIVVPDREKTDVAAKTGTKDHKDPTGERFLVQITSCKNKKVAEEVAKDIGKIGYKPHIVTVDLKEKGRWYRVILTDLASREKAQEAAQKIDRILKGNKSEVRVQKR